MGKILNVVVGLIIGVVGVILLLAWWYEFLFLIRATLPVILVLAGLIALIAGLSELKDSGKAASEEKK